MVREVTLNGNIIEEWSTVIEKGQGNAAQLCRSAAAHILASRIPHLYLELVQVRPRGMFQSVEPRGYLRVSHARLKFYYIYIGARDYGTYLDVRWFVTHEPDFLAALFSSGGLNMFQQEELRVLVEVVRRRVIQASEDLLISISQDASQLVDRKAKGFLGVST